MNDRGIRLALGGYLVFFAARCVFAFIVSRKDWRRETSSLLEEIRQRRQELEQG